MTQTIRYFHFKTFTIIIEFLLKRKKYNALRFYILRIKKVYQFSFRVLTFFRLNIKFTLAYVCLAYYMKIIVS